MPLHCNGSDIGTRWGEVSGIRVLPGAPLNQSSDEAENQDSMAAKNSTVKHKYITNACR